MKPLPLLLVAAACLSACSTVAALDPPPPAPAPAPAALTPAEERGTAEGIKRNGPSPVPRDGWVETVSGWYRSTEACLEHKRRDVVGTPLSVTEECLKPNN